MIKFKHFVLVVLISLIVNIAGLYIYDKFFAQKIVTFDLKGYIEALRILYVNGKIDDNEVKRRIDYLEEIVNSTPKRKVIITSDVILGRGRVETIGPEIKVPSPEKQ